MSSTTPALAGTNLSILVGTLIRPPETRSLPSGDTVLSLELRVQADGTPAESVPVAWFDPPAAAGSWAPGEELLVVGRVRRRFFRSGGATQSRTEVVARSGLPTRRGAATRKVLRAALDSLESAVPGL